MVLTMEAMTCLHTRRSDLTIVHRDNIGRKRSSNKDEEQVPLTGALSKTSINTALNCYNFVFDNVCVCMAHTSVC